MGKSSLLQRFTSDSFDENKESTIGALFITKKVYVEGDQDDELKLINFQIWDTAGQERYKSLTPMYYRNSNIALIVFDLTDLGSFKKAERWFEELKMFNSDEAKNLKIYLVGNKCDLVENQDPVPYLMSAFVRDNKISVIQTSARTGEGVSALFDKIIADVDDSMFVDVDTLESRNSLKRKKSTIIDLTSFQNMNDSNCAC